LFADAALAVLARAPVPGAVKTRLVGRHVSAVGAAAVHEAFTLDVLDRHGAEWAARTLWVAVSSLDAPEAEAVVRTARGGGWDVVLQPDGDLGARIAAAVDGGLVHSAVAVVIGTDSPNLPDGHFAAAVDALRTHDVALSPADDGGFTLIAARAPCPWLSQVEGWGTEHALQRVEVVAARHGVSTVRVAPWYDVDNVADLARLRVDCERERGAALARTRALLRGLDLTTLDGDT